MSPKDPPNTAPPAKSNKTTVPQKEAFWRGPYAAPLITAILGGLAALITALSPFILPTFSRPTATPTLPVVATPSATPLDFCQLYYDYLPVYEVTVGVPAEITPTRTLEKPFALKFMDESRHIGGLKLEHRPADRIFLVYSHVGADCDEISPTGKGQEYLPGVENEIVFPEFRYLFRLEVTNGSLRVEIRRK